VENQSKFHLQKSVLDFKSLIKSYGQISERKFEIVKENVPSNPSLNFDHNFLLETLNVKRISVDKIWFNLPSSFSSKVFEKNYSTMTK